MHHFQKIYCPNQDRPSKAKWRKVCVKDSVSCSGSFIQFVRLVFILIQKNVNLATSLYFGAETEFIIAAQTFSSLRIAKCGLELTITIH